MDRNFHCPPLVHNHVVREGDLTAFMTKDYELSETRVPKGTKRLVQSFLPQKEILLHIAYVKFLIERGVDVEVVGGYWFGQRIFYKKFGELCKKMRLSSPEDKALAKLMLNSLYGKCMQSRVYNDIELVKDFTEFVNIQQKADIKRIIPLSDEMTFFEKRRKYSWRVNPIHVGKCILDWAKTVFFGRVYDVLDALKAKGLEATTLYTDTDSIQLIVSEKSEPIEESVFERMSDSERTTSERDRLTLEEVYGVIGEFMDTSNFQQDHPSFSAANEGKFGLFKSEVADRVVEEIIALSPKVYSLEEVGQDARIVRHKGIPTRLAKRALLPHLYRGALYHFRGTKKVHYKSIGGYKFDNYTSNNVRSSLNRCNMKRKFFGPQHSVPWGYYSDVPPFKVDEMYDIPPQEIPEFDDEEVMVVEEGEEEEEEGLMEAPEPHVDDAPGVFDEFQLVSMAKRPRLE